MLEFWVFDFFKILFVCTNKENTFQVPGSRVCGKNAIHTMSEPLAHVETGYYVHIQTFRARWGLRVQMEMLAYLDQNNLTPTKACEGKHGAPHSIAYETLRRWWKHFLLWGETPFETARRPGIRYGERTRLDPGIGDRIIAIIDEDPSLYLDEIQNILVEEFGKKYHTSTIWRFLNSPPVNITLHVLQEKAVQQSWYEQMIYRGTMSVLSANLDPSVFCFVDESAVGKNAARRRRGWARKGTKAIKYTVFDDGTSSKQYTLIGAVDINGFIPAGCEVIFRRTKRDQPGAGTVDQDRFVQYVRERLVPQLGSYALGEPRSVVIMDNARIHKHPLVRTLIENTGAKLVWNAAYSPELNPIEPCFHQYKACLRRNREHFSLDMWAVHDFALKTSVTRDNMIRYYGSNDMQGCIHNLPTIVSVPTGHKQAAEVERKKKKRKHDEEEEEEMVVVMMMMMAAKRRRML